MLLVIAVCYCHIVNINARRQRVSIVRSAVPLDWVDTRRSAETAVFYGLHTLSAEVVNVDFNINVTLLIMLKAEVGVAIHRVRRIADILDNDIIALNHSEIEANRRRIVINIPHLKAKMMLSFVKVVETIGYRAHVI